jgi:serine/threonine protein kinase/formylglycine-generating enzyme required for sulfatase activity
MRQEQASQPVVRGELPVSASLNSAADATRTPTFIGRYRVERLLGAGTSGRVYLAHDDQLQRQVAIKIPRLGEELSEAQVEEFLREARAAATLDHPNIVPVFDIGSSDSCQCFVVSKFIDGSDLEARMKSAPLSLAQSVEFVATVADALHYAHKNGLVHRDIKPSNLLLDHDDRPMIADFGLALRDQDFGHKAELAGTPAFMSPEQARGEAHRVDGRADIFSLGAVLYTMIAGRRPFRGDTQAEVLDQVRNLDPRPLRAIDENIPMELDRICAKALAKRAADRYAVAKDMAADLRAFLMSEHGISANSVTTTVHGDASAQEHGSRPGSTSASPRHAGSASAAAAGLEIRVVPKGLRSFDATDSDFFLGLLPGPQDRDGIPESIRFWKTRIETVDADETFAVGLIYGPSGCGKSSLMKAGLLPRLDRSVRVIYLEATSDKTESTLLNALRRRIPELPQALTLSQTLACLRQGKVLAGGGKVLVVLDQFEQWLHANSAEEQSELVQALRQCDGEHLQSIIMVRDDFWMAATRFMRELEIPLVEGQNSAAVDLFPLRHAQRVLTAFGRAFGELPAHGDLSKPQRQFIEEAVNGLAQDGKVVTVRLALFAEMFKGKPWNPETLRRVGGTEGVGVAFLEETFSASTAPPLHRVHRVAAQAVLRALLPEVGSDIKGYMRSRSQLQAISGYGSKVREFDELMQLLDRDLRLITPTETVSTGEVERSPAGSGSPVPEGYFQLTHDYLVPSLRDWLTSKQKETRKGRAELLLTDRASVWNSRRESRQLPSITQWVLIRWWTVRAVWTDSQRMMMRAAARHYAFQSAIVVVAIAIIALVGRDGYGRLQAHALMAKLDSAQINEVPSIIAQMEPYRGLLEEPLRQELQAAVDSNDRRGQTLYQLALLPVDVAQADELFAAMLDAEPGDFVVIRDALFPVNPQRLEALWEAVAEEGPDARRARLRSAAALARYAPEDPQWSRIGAIVASDIVDENASFLGAWSAVFRPVRGVLLKPLSVIFSEHAPDRTAERNLATSLLSDYANDRPELLCELVLVADKEQFAQIVPLLQPFGPQSVRSLVAALGARLSSDASAEARATLASHQANAAVALMRLDQAALVWQLLQHSPDPQVRSYIIDRCADFGVDPAILVAREGVESDITIRRALLQALGGYSAKQVPKEIRRAFLKRVENIFTTDPDAGMHASAQWLLQQWRGRPWLAACNVALMSDPQTPVRRIATLKSAQESTADKPAVVSPRWIINARGETEVVIFGPVEFMMGRAENSDRQEHPVRIQHSFVVGETVVTLEQYRRMNPDYLRSEKGWNASAGDIPVVRVNWFMAARYCNWLSEQEGIAKDQWCFEIGPEDSDVQLKPNYQKLKGYRLPTEAEMEYAIRANASTDYYFGDAVDLLYRYAWYQLNSQSKGWPVAMLKPNDFGIFDPIGNVWEWCADWSGEYPSTVAVDPQGPESGTERILRGGDEYYGSDLCRAWGRGSLAPDYRGFFSGFRVARTP